MFSILGLALAIVLVLGAGAHAASLVTGAVPVGAGDDPTCTALNVKFSPIAEDGAKKSSIAAISVQVVFLDAAGRSTASGGTTCSDVGLGDVCLLPILPESSSVAMYCLIEFTGGKQSVRGLMCNATTGACSDAR